MSRVTHVESGTADVALSGRTVVGVVVRESAASPGNAEVIVRHGVDSSGTPIYFKTLASNEEPAGAILPSVECLDGVFIQRVAGTTELLIFWGSAPAIG